MKNAEYLLGTALTPAQQAEALRVYVHRYTGQHRPQWSFKPRLDGSAYPVQFKDDADWLAHTTFRVTARGTMPVKLPYTLVPTGGVVAPPSSASRNIGFTCGSRPHITA
jgi:hypothetical protein